MPPACPPSPGPAASWRGSTGPQLLFLFSSSRSRPALKQPPPRDKIIASLVYYIVLHTDDDDDDDEDEDVHSFLETPGSKKRKKKERNPARWIKPDGEGSQDRASGRGCPPGRKMLGTHPGRSPAASPSCLCTADLDDETVRREREIERGRGMQAMDRLIRWSDLSLANMWSRSAFMDCRRRVLLEKSPLTSAWHRSEQSLKWDSTALQSWSLPTLRPPPRFQAREKNGKSAAGWRWNRSERRRALTGCGRRPIGGPFGSSRSRVCGPDGGDGLGEGEGEPYVHEVLQLLEGVDVAGVDEGLELPGDLLGGRPDEALLRPLHLRRRPPSPTRPPPSQKRRRVGCASHGPGGGVCPPHCLRLSCTPFGPYKVGPISVSVLVPAAHDLAQ